MQIHDEAPTSFGVNGWDGYHEMIPAKAWLPYKKTTNFVNALDNCHRTAFSVLSRHSMLSAPTNLAGVELPGIRVAKEGVTKIKATMSLGKNLVGTLHVYDTYTRSAASVVFDGGIALRALNNHGLIPKNN